MKLLLLTNGIYAIPIIQMLTQNRAIESVVLTDEMHDGTAQVETACGQIGVGVVRIRQERSNEDLEDLIKNSGATLVLTCGFPWKINSKVLSLPNVDFMNFHFAKLPEYRGSAPVFWEIKNGESAGAACLHVLTDDIDKGPILSMKPVPISPFDTFGMHMLQCAVKAADMLQSLLLELQSGNWKYRLREQPSHDAKYQQRPALPDLVISWDTMTANQIVALINACNPWNKGAYTAWNGMQLRILSARVVSQYTEQDGVPGFTVSADIDQGVYVMCLDKQVIKLEVFMIEEGFFPGGALTQLGLAKGAIFDSKPLLQMLPK